MNIVVCCTPLQVLIALRVMEQYPGERFYGILYGKMELSKFAYYRDKLAERCEQVDAVMADADSRIKMFVSTVGLLLRGARLPRAKRLFIASLDLIDMHIMLWRQSKAEVITFDDGSLNLSPKVFEEMLNTPPGGLYRGLKRIFGFLGSLEWLERKQRHYTIYTLPNVMGDSYYLPIFQNINRWGGVKTQTEGSGDVKVILLGQPIYGVEDSERIQRLMQYIIERFAPDYYLPHPRETYQIKGITYMRTNLIFEDWIFGELRNNPSQRYKVYTLCSTSAINLAGVEGLEFVALRPADVELYDEVYALMRQLGHEIIDLPAL